MVKRLGRISAAVIGLLVLAVWCGAVDFSAETVTKVNKTTMKGKICRQGKKFRQESGAGGMKRIIILRPDKKLMYVINPAAKTYMEMPRQSGIDATNPYDPAKLRKFGTVKILGSEKCNGFMCEKSRFTATDKRMGGSTQWIAKDLKWPMKVETKTSQGTVVTETKNVKVGKVSSALFEVPKGYKKEAMPKMPHPSGAPPKGTPSRPMPAKP